MNKRALKKSSLSLRAKRSNPLLRLLRHYAPRNDTAFFSSLNKQTANKKVILILGGARSGKSSFAQNLAQKLGEKVLFVATGQALDEEMQARIEEHKKARPAHWHTLELPADVGKGIEAGVCEAEIVIIDCLTLLVSNLLTGETTANTEKRVVSEIEQLINCINKLEKNFIIVSNEIGTGLVPENGLARYYRDLLGKVNQLIARRAEEVYLMVTGIPVQIK